MNLFNNLTQCAANYANYSSAENISHSFKDVYAPILSIVYAGSVSFVCFEGGVKNYVNKDYKVGMNNFLASIFNAAASEYTYSKSFNIACSISGGLSFFHVGRSIKQLVIDKNLLQAYESASDSLMFLALAAIEIDNSYMLSTAATLSFVALKLIKQKLFPFAALPGLAFAAPAG